MDLVIFIFILSTVVLSLVLHFTVNKSSQILKALEDSNRVIDLQTKLIQEIYDSNTQWLNHLKYIDSNGSLEADDEIGFFFEQLKTAGSVIEGYNRTIESVSNLVDNDEE
jgi:hypothetical protein